ncbi:glycosyl transferase [Arthrobacter alpinus]|uniref:Glycosyl transferase n=1 Tax=Arthrobacter alpinus TaxID=656366 RepID=A0A0M4QX63_9MICC|nr:glycosyltransferase [Arthrobacter alpinus]ALE92686.1 glycosyl transferase [Arthrobacter alpinus]
MSVAEKTENAVAAQSQQWSTIQRVILPHSGQMETLPLYVDAGLAVSAAVESEDGLVSRREAVMSSAKVLAAQTPAHADDVLSRESLIVRPGERVSFGTYFNAFAASYWRRWTTVRDIRLSVRTSGQGHVSVYKSNARGSLQHVATTKVSDKDALTNFDLSLNPFGDGGWYWFDVAGGAGDFQFQGAEWQTEAERRIEGSLTVEITTMNKQSYCINNLELLAADPDCLKNVRELIVVDQGSLKVTDADGFVEVAEALAGKLRIINQDNLGGSGGFARGMYEAVQNGSDYVLLLDDDVVLETESIERMITFADFCKKPTIVGGHMFDLHDRNILHTFGETIDAYSIKPAEPNPGQRMRHDFSQSNLRQTSWMHRRVDVDYNGWWMCLIPTEVIREIGLSLPVFIKWDDQEYGVRAKAAGFPTVSLPGSAVWHISWIDKDDSVDWQAYFHARNRYIYALLHSPYRRAGGLFEHAFKTDVKHLMSMQYFTVQARMRAMQDLLRGPDVLHEILATKLGEIRQLGTEFTETQFHSELEDFPALKSHKMPRRGKSLRPPSYVTLAPWAARNVLRQLVKPVNDVNQEHPEAFLAHQDNKWWRISQFDSALVSKADGTSVSWYKRDPRKVRQAITSSGLVYSDLLRNWNKLSAEYREALPRITSMEQWGKTFAAHSEKSEK